MPQKNGSDEVAPTRFGTFGGVFTPCTLTILGVIMFLRFGQVVGQAGVLWTLLIVVLAKFITTSTGFSLAAIATNTRVRGGGAYFLISRSLGVEFGGSIGVVFFLAQAVSVAMYIIGFTEAFLFTFPDVGLSFRVIATAVNVAVFVCVFIGAGWTIKVQYGILAVLGLSLVSFFTGAVGNFSLDHWGANLGSDYSDGHGFFTTFALFFPAVTGIMAGANMSGDLENPGRSIPRGTLWAILVTGVVYAVMALFLGAVADRETLKTDAMVVREVSWSPLLITAGIFAATLSSALGSMMGAPRILQALAKDEIFNVLAPLARGSGRSNEPRRAVVVTFVVAQAGIMSGDLNAIAPIITMFFMITYGYLNLATFFESLARNPSYRPTFRFSHWSIELAGAIGCAAVMFLVSPIWAAVAVVGMATLHGSIARRRLISTWGDLKSGIAFERARKNLLRLEDIQYHPKNWRPAILAMAGGAGGRPELAVYGHWLAGGRGLLTLGQVIVGEVDEHLRRRTGQEQILRKYIVEQELEAFPAVLVAPSLGQGIEALVQVHGLGALRPNLVLAGFSEDPSRREEFGNLYRLVLEMKRNMVVMRVAASEGDPWIAPEGTVDVWWRGSENGPLMLILAHLLLENDAWRGRPLRLLRLIPSEAGRADAEKHLEELLGRARLQAEIKIVVGTDFRTESARTSSEAAVVFLGFKPPAPGAESAFFDDFGKLLEPFKTVVLVSSAGDANLDA